MIDKYPLITLCGNTRFKDPFMEEDIGTVFLYMSTLAGMIYREMREKRKQDLANRFFYDVYLDGSKHLYRVPLQHCYTV